MKEKRVRAIQNLVSKRRIRTQGELLRELRALGFRTTQATISRDLEELGFLKDRKTGYYEIPAEGAEEDKLLRLQGGMRDYVRSIETAGNLVVVKTTPGGAQGVALGLDQMNWAEVMGTVAGDDTILVVATDLTAGKKIAQRLKRIKEKG